ncbi:dipeptidase [Agromyces sp. NPDC056379]|uniref:dipeptidase n=1 Tax=unclassified Agromyces TaxID=2639701 RepID=UPI0035D901FA
MQHERFEIPVFDGHNDLPWTARTERGYSVEGLDGSEPTPLHTDIPKLRDGGVAGQFWSVWVDSKIEGAAAVRSTLEQIDFVHRMAARYPETFELATTAETARRAIEAGRIASMIGVEGGGQIDNSLAVLREYARLGARYMTLTWTSTSDWADSATDEARHGGLTEFGREVVAEMNRIGVLVDLAHVSVATADAALDTSTRPTLVSHSSAAALNPHPRNMPDRIIRRVADGGGVYMVTFVPSFLTAERREWVDGGETGPKPPVTVADAADHVEHVRNVAGIDGVGLGGDYDGTDDMPEGLDDVSGYPVLFAELARRGWTEPELRKLGTENVLRVVAASDDDYLGFTGAGSSRPVEA